MVELGEGHTGVGRPSLNSQLRREDDCDVLGVDHHHAVVGYIRVRRLRPRRHVPDHHVEILVVSQHSLRQVLVHVPVSWRGVLYLPVKEQAEGEVHERGWGYEVAAVVQGVEGVERSLI